MKGATALPDVSIIKPPKITKIIIIGNNHSFFLEFKKWNISESKENIFFN